MRTKNFKNYEHFNYRPRNPHGKAGNEERKRRNYWKWLDALPLLTNSECSQQKA